MFRILYFISLLGYCYSANILGLALYPATSHSSFFNAVWKALSLKGHNVTVITPNPQKDNTLTNLTEIGVENVLEIMYKIDWVRKLSKDNWMIESFTYSKLVLGAIAEGEISHEDTLKLLNSGTNFDVIIVEPHHPLVFVVGSKFKAPIIALSSFDVFLEIYDYLGNPTHPILAPDMLVHIDATTETMTYFERLKSLTFNILYRLFYYWYFLPNSEEIARKYYGNDITPLGDVMSNISLLIINRNPIVHPVRPFLPNIISVGHIHIKPSKELPEDLQNFLDSSKKGVIYFSLGTTVANIKEEFVDTIIQTFFELPFNVIWKWDTEDIPNKPKNVLVKKWIPQQDLLGHPKVKVFVTQAGLQSVEEAIFKEVPMVGIPFVGDQPHNVKKMSEIGIAVGLDPQTLTKQKLRNAILEVAGNSRYKERLIEAKKILEEEPLRGMEKVIWWIDYVIRHKGAAHLRSPSADMKFYEYFLLDVFALIASTFVFVYFIIFKIMKNLCFCFRRNKVKKD